MWWCGGEALLRFGLGEVEGEKAFDGRGVVAIRLEVRSGWKGLEQVGEELAMTLKYGTEVGGMAWFEDAGDF